MAGVEPASERLDSRMSTSVASCSGSSALRSPAELPTDYSLEPESSLRSGSRKAARHSDFYDILAGFGQKNDSGGRGHKLVTSAISDQLIQLKEELRSLCDWHLFFVLILRGRHLSARNPEPASPVETWHPLAPPL